METVLLRDGSMQTPIASYFAHEATDPQAVARCFTEDAVVVDERQEHRGRAAIAAWNAAAVAKFGITTQVLAIEDEDGAHTTVRAKVSGTFPGSPIELLFRFTLQGALIARLEIAP
ncbi:MAG: nuclear transport factor 2 family protein [Labilithrix sp.]|nr:nuclear transport factor 2 family protein [Labilithrix sp.]MCW5810202.1 nuclear transport factor 2 family protein [Labilithrix sp.]